MLHLKVNHKMSESTAVAVMLTLAGGFQDAYSYNCRGGVFANAQTGNIVLLGQNLAQGNFQSALRYLMPLAAFIAGVYITEWLQHIFKEQKIIHWRQIVLLAETLLLVAVGLLPHSLDMSANILMSFACAMQVNSFRTFKGIPFASTMCVGNLRSATAMLSKYHVTKDSALKKTSLRYYFVILVFALGAAVGAVVSIQIGIRAIWIASAMLFVGGILMYAKESGLSAKQQ